MNTNYIFHFLAAVLSELLSTLIAGNRKITYLGDLGVPVINQTISH